MNRPDFHPGKPVTLNFDTESFESITITTTEYCPTCHGEGYEMHEVRGGVYLSGSGVWIPDERKEVCERCDGAGTVIRTRCAACGLLHHSDEWGVYASEAECDCDPADLFAFYYRVTEPRGGFAPVKGLGWNEIHYVAARDGKPVMYDRAGALVWPFLRAAGGEVQYGSLS